DIKVSTENVIEVGTAPTIVEDARPCKNDGSSKDARATNKYFTRFGAAVLAFTLLGLLCAILARGATLTNGVSVGDYKSSREVFIAISDGFVYTTSKALCVNTTNQALYVNTTSKAPSLSLSAIPLLTSVSAVTAFPDAWDGGLIKATNSVDVSKDELDSTEWGFRIDARRKRTNFFLNAVFYCQPKSTSTNSNPGYSDPQCRLANNHLQSDTMPKILSSTSVASVATTFAEAWNSALFNGTNTVDMSKNDLGSTVCGFGIDAQHNQTNTFLKPFSAHDKPLVFPYCRIGDNHYQCLLSNDTNQYMLED
ncbi:hypothetical protein HDU96_004806, partial [Phlyctochytrium bullatum]